MPDHRSLVAQAAWLIREHPNGISTEGLAVALTADASTFVDDNDITWALYEHGRAYAVGQALNGLWYHVSSEGCDPGVKARHEIGSPPCPWPGHTSDPSPTPPYTAVQSALVADILASHAKLLEDILGPDCRGIGVLRRMVNVAKSHAERPPRI